MTGIEAEVLEGTYTQSNQVISRFSMSPNMQISSQPSCLIADSEAKLDRACLGETKRASWGLLKVRTLRLD